MAEQKPKKMTTKKGTSTKHVKMNQGKIMNRRQHFGDSILDEIILILMIAASVVVLISLLSNKMGIVGHLISNVLKGGLGIGAVMIPILAIVYSLWLLLSEEKNESLIRLFSGIAFLLCISISAGVLFPIHFDDNIGAFAKTSYYYQNGGFLNGGIVGGWVGSILLAAFDKLGSMFILLVVLLICMIVCTGKSFFQIIENIILLRKARKKVYREKIKSRAEQILEQEEREAEKLAKKEAKKEAKREARQKAKSEFNILITPEEELMAELIEGERNDAIKLEKSEKAEILSENTALQKISDRENNDSSHEPPKPPTILSSNGFVEDENNGDWLENVFSPKEVKQKKLIAVQAENIQQLQPFHYVAATEKENQAASEMEKPYQFPPLDLLTKDTSTQNKGSKVQMLKNAQKLEETLKSFGVEATVIQINKGPTVTRYELSPSKGVKVSKIVNLSDDIALNLAASGIRIEAPIPGKAAVGIEVPNKETKSVYLRSVMESDAFFKFPSKLAFALGQDIAGNPVIADIAKMPHLLIAGATGSGKSVCINTLITSILYKANPKEVKLLLVDPKVVELSVYNGVPHLLIPVVTDPKKAAAALNWAVREMLSRYNDFADNNVRDISGFNALKRENNEQELLMSQIIIVIDELADLMMAAPSEVEEAICRLAQMARAAGMHLIIATQRPSVDVITGVIKANIPSRLAFSVSSGIDSRTILDMVGAEKLLGKGDMLFYPAGISKPQRIQGAFVTDKEVESIVQFVKQNGAANHDEAMIEQITASTKSDDQNQEVDELFDRAVDLVVEKEKASASMLQRQFRIGYNRASRLIEELESHGIVGSEDGSKPRKVLIGKLALEEMRNPSNIQD